MKEIKSLSKKDVQKHLPVLGAFRDYITEALNYLFTLKDEETILATLGHIRNGFKDLPEDAPYDPHMNAIWTLMTLTSEINHQAAEQGHTIITEENVDESISNLLNSFEIGNKKDTEEIYKDGKINYDKVRKEQEDKWSKKDEAAQLKTLVEKEALKLKKSTED